MKPKAKEKPVFWSCDPDAEEYQAESKEEAIQEYLENRDPLPLTLTVTGYARDVIDVEREVEMRTGKCGPLAAVLENLDDDWKNPDEPTKPTPAMLEAERTFLRAVLREVTVWNCHEVCSEESNVRAWVEANAPEWIDGDEDERKEWES